MRRLRLLVVPLMAALAACGSAGTAPQVDRGVPPEVEAVVMQIRQAADAGDHETLAGLALAREPFTASLGQVLDDPHELAAFWQQMEQDGEPVLEILVGLIDLADWYATPTFTTADEQVTIFVSPEFMHSPTDENRQALEDAIGAPLVARSMVSGQYLGWRIGVTDRGNWQFFVSGE